MSKRTTQKNIPLGAGATIEKDLKEALNYETALTYGLEKVESGAPITLSLIKELHSMLLEDVRNEGDIVGDFRDHMVHLTSPQQDSVRSSHRLGGAHWTHELA